MAILTLIFGRDSLGTFDINGNKMIIGRADDCDIVIDNLAVSRHHAIIEKWDGGYCIKDLDSNNGTFVNGRKITEAKSLSFGDQIGIGKHVLLFDTHARRLNPAGAPSHGEALPDMDSPGKGTMFVEPEKMEKMQKKGTAARKAHLRLKGNNGLADTLIPLDKNDTSLGKGPNCDIPLKGFFCSKKHAVLRRLEEGFQLLNFALLQPTRVNGTRVESTFLCDGDEIRIGRYSFVFHSNQ
jgi:pSer/pThr/pTyr-binding forkhead associated (FHA) protein